MLIILVSNKRLVKSNFDIFKKKSQSGDRMPRIGNTV